MTHLEARLNALNFPNQLEIVNSVLDAGKIKTRVTFWGARVVEVTGYEGSVSLDTLARRVLHAANQRCASDDLTPPERIAGIDIVGKLDGFYRATDAQISSSNFFTRFLVWIREFNCFIPYTTRFYIEDCAESRFCAYSEEKFRQQFGRPHNESYGSFGAPLRIVAERESIRALLPPA